jgi:hypothetical protein
MSTIKDVFDILKENPEIAKKAGKFFTNIFSNHKNKKADKEVINDFKTLLAAIEDDDFEKEFTKKLDYYALLMGLIVKAVFVTDKGIVINNFYNPSFHLYFPPVADEPKLIKQAEGTKEERWMFGKDDGKAYHFHFFIANPEKITLTQLNSHLELALEKGENEEAAFISKLKEIEVYDYWCFGVTAIEDKTGIYRLYQGIHNWDGELDSYNFGRFASPKSIQIKKQILSDIRYVLDNY